MSSLPETSVSSTARSRWPRRLAYAAGAIVALIVAAWLAVPPLVRSQVESRLTDALGRRTTLESVAFDPFRLRLTLRNLGIADPAADVPLFAFDELVADVSSASLWRWAPVLDAVRIVRPRLNLARGRDDRYNVQDLLDRARAAPEGPPPRFSLNNIEIEDGSAVVDDRKTDRRHALAALDVAIPFVSSLPYQTDIVVTPRVGGTLNGSRFELKGSTTPFAEHREATLDVDLDALPLPQFIVYLPSVPVYDLAGGALSTRLTIAFVEDAANRRTLELRGSAHVDELAIKRRDGSPLVAAKRIAVQLDRVAVLGRDARIASVVIDAPSVSVKRRADGTLELAQPAFGPAVQRPAAAAGVPAPEARPWSASLAALKVTNGAVALTDETSGFQSTLADVAVDATNLTTRPGDKTHVRLGFVTADRIASFTGEADVEPLVPTATGRFELAKFSLGLLFPYYRDVLAIDVQKGSLDLASRFALHADGNLTLDGGKASIVDLVMALPGQRAPLWRIPTMVVEGIAVDVDAREVALGEVQSGGAALRLVRERDGTLEIERMLKPARATAGNEAGGGWSVVAKKLVLERATIDAEDRVPDPDVKLAIRNIDVTALDLSNVQGAKSRWNVRARVAPRGRFAFSGTLATRPVALSGTVDAADLPLLVAKPYVEPQVNVVLTDGALAARGRVSVDVPDRGPARAAWKGNVAVAAFAALDKPTSSDLVRWKSLVVEEMDVATSPFRASIGRIGLEDFYARVIVYPDATLNLARLVTPGATPVPEPGARPAPASEASPAGEGLPLAIGRIEVARGSVDFTDLFVQPNYSANLTDVAGSVSALSSEQPGDVTLTARVGGAAPVEVQGHVHPFAPQLSLDLAGKARDIDLPPLTPYAVKYAGYGIEKGKLTFDVRYRVEDRKLSADNRLVLDQLTFGERVESPTATKLPVLLAVALLKDARGVIDINLPISGSLDDPQFSVGGLIVRVIVNLITKAVTAPFALLAAAFGGGEELSTLEFAGGSAAIGTEAQKRIDTLGKALADRPGLKVDIGGRADPAADREALRRASIETALRREKMKAMAEAGQAPASVDQVTIAADERERWLRAAYRASNLPDRPRNVFGVLKDVPPADMEAMLLANATVDDDALRQLAARRAQTVKDALAAKGVAGERLFLVAPKLGTEAGVKGETGDKPRTPARVDLALR